MKKLFKAEYNLRRQGKSETSKLKREIQGYLRTLAIKRDGGCVLRTFFSDDIPPCNGYTKNGDLILQYDHLNPRGFNVSYADIRLGVTLCKGHHGWKKWNKERYDGVVRELIGEERAALWDKVKTDRRSHPMGAYEWAKIAIALKAEIKTIK